MIHSVGSGEVLCGLMMGFVRRRIEVGVWILWRIIQGLLWIREFKIFGERKEGDRN
jgi:uncharacterized membrane protein